MELDPVPSHQEDRDDPEYGRNLHRKILAYHRPIDGETEITDPVAHIRRYLDAANEPAE